MVTIDEIKEKATTLGVPLPVIEKDYVIGWLLNKIYLNPFLSQNLLLKGGNCIRKAYIKNTRFSDDLDFTISRYVNENNFREIIVQICKELSADVGIDFNIDQTRITEKPTADNECKAIDGRVYFRGFAGDDSLNFRVKFDLSDYERIVLPAQRHPLIHSFSDSEKCQVNLYSYSLEEVLAEKLRCWIQRTRSRDLYDIVHIIQSKIIPISYKNILSAFLKKTIYKNIVNVGKDELLYAGKFKTIEISWLDTLVCPKNSLVAATNAIELFKNFVEALFHEGNLEASLGSNYFRRQLRYFRFKVQQGVREAIIASAQERKLIQMTYSDRARVIEPYSFKYAKQGYENFYGWDRTRGNHIKCFNLYKVQGVSILPDIYSPRYTIEI